MKKMKNWKLLLLTLVMVLFTGLFLTGCDNGNGNGDGDGGNTNGETTTYTVSVKSVGGMNMSEIDVYVYTDDSLGDLKEFGKTDANGIATFNLPASDKYAIALSGLPKGYEVAKSYSFKDGTAIISVESKLITGDDLGAVSTPLKVGDVMYDFTVTNYDGEKLTLSEILKEKKMVMLNFWYTTCSWCMTEFPIMGNVYDQYKDDIEIIALNPLEDAATVKSFQDGSLLPFKLAACPASWANSFGVTGYPTSVFIDQYGVICLVESGAITTNRPFVCAFDHFTADDYEQKLCEGVADLLTAIKPNVTMESSEAIGEAINKGEIEVTYSPVTGNGAETTWPFIIGEKNGEKCIYASNKEVEDSYAIIYAEVSLKAGQAIGFDYLASTESGSDILHVIVNDQDIFRISGVNAVEKWESCYPWVASEDGVYKLALCYLKDSDTNEGDDTVYIKDLRVVDSGKIDTETYIPMEAATSEDGFEYKYVDIVYNEADGYYHVGQKNGPLLLANLLGVSQFNEENAVYLMYSESGELMVNGKNVFKDFEQYSSYASNSAISGYCPVTKDLAEYLKQIDKEQGFDDKDNNEWLKLCKYYAAYGTSKQLADPIQGLAMFSAYKATFGKNVATNFFYYDRPIMPRGTFAEFIPSQSGVYRITSRSEKVQGLNAWIFNENREELLVYEPDERMYEGDEVSMVYYMEAGKKYYINIAFWDVYEVGTIYYDIEYIGSTFDLFRLASPGYFTYDSNATGDAMYHTIAGGIDVVLGEDGIYYHAIKDANGNVRKGSKLYADFTGITGIFSQPIYGTNGVKGMIEMNGFDFSKTENDLFVIGIKNTQGSDEATIKYLKEYWGADYEFYFEEYKVNDVLAGRYHGEGKDLTNEIKKYISQIDTSNTERQGCVVVTKELAEILQQLMDKYTFKGVDHSWTKVCYYYDHLGPQ